MKQLIIILHLLLVTCLNLNSQSQAKIWYFGYGSGLDFNCAPPKPIEGHTSDLEGVSAISDQSGNLLFYTDGDTIWNKKHAVMQNGVNIGGRCSNYGGQQSSSQGALIIKHPGNVLLYYVFTADCAEDSLKDGIRYSIVDLSMNSGLGSVVNKQKLLFAPGTEKLAAVKHSNDTSSWLLSHEYDNNKFRAYLITKNGLDSNHITSIVGQIHHLNSTTFPHVVGRGYLKFSPDGTKIIAIAHGLFPELFSFNKSSGQITKLFKLPNPTWENFYGASFSTNSKLLYLNTCDWSNRAVMELVQFDVSSSDSTTTWNSKYYLHNENYIDSAYSVHPDGALQLGPDGKIYIPTVDWKVEGQYIAVINYPDSIGASCNFDSDAIRLRCDMRVGDGLPNFVESLFLSKSMGAICPPINAEFTTKSDTTICTEDSFLLSINDTVTSVLWWDSSTFLSRYISDSGTYWAEYTDKFGCKLSDTIAVSVDSCLGQNINENLIQHSCFYTIYYDHDREEIQFSNQSNSNRYTLLLFDFQGRQIDSIELSPSSTFTYNSSYLGRGFYVIKSHCGTTDKILIIK